MKFKVGEKTRTWNLFPEDRFEYTIDLTEQAEDDDFHVFEVVPTEVRLTITAEYFFEGEPIGTR